jgi:hypothetical protein
MDYWFAGLFAAGVAWLINRVAVKYFGESAVIWLIPWLEELVKTGVAVLSGTSIILTHGVFGLLEAVHDYVASPRWGIPAGLLSIISHWFYGLVTFTVYQSTSLWPVSVLSAAFLHVGWNYLMVRLFSLLQRK